jgi:hypothetical protein
VVEAGKSDAGIACRIGWTGWFRTLKRGMRSPLVR